MKTKLLALALLGVGTMFAGPRIGIGVGIGVGPAYPYGYAAPAPVYVAPAPAYVAPAPYVAPGPVVVGTGWVNGYWYNVGGRRVWHAGYWGGPRGYRGFRR